MYLLVIENSIRNRDHIDSTRKTAPLKIPDEAKIIDTENKNTPRILPCYLRDVTTTFNPSNQSMHANGEFGEIDMSLAFTETRTLSRKI